MIGPYNGHVVGCCCESCTTSRRIIMMANHPLHNKPKEPLPTPIPVDQALAMTLEARDIYREALARTESEIKILRDCGVA